MLTRLGVAHDYIPDYPAPVNVPGAIKLRRISDTVIAAMPIARPNSSPSPDGGAPFYTAATYQYHQNVLFRGPSPDFSPARPNLEMDPSDATSWQREYRFT